MEIQNIGPKSDEQLKNTSCTNTMDQPSSFDKALEMLNAMHKKQLAKIKREQFMFNVIMASFWVLIVFFVLLALYHHINN